MFTVLLVDDNIHWLRALEAGISKDPMFQVAGIAQNGKVAIESIKKYKPDIILLDIIMPKYDGAYIVKYIRENIPGYDPVIYILSGIGTNTIINILSDLEIDFYSLKPVSIEMVLANLKSIISHKKKAYETPPLKKAPDYEHQVDQLLSGLGLYKNVMSTLYIRDALLFFLQSPEGQRSLTKSIYPAVAERYQTSASAVERSIRLGIVHMEKANTELYREIFHFSPGHKKITNSLLLSLCESYLAETNAYA